MKNMYHVMIEKFVGMTAYEKTTFKQTKYELYNSHMYMYIGMLPNLILVCDDL